MRIRTPLEIGLVIRERRRERELTQMELARKVGVGRQWVVAVEQGKSGAELGLVLRTLNVLDIHLVIGDGKRLVQPTLDIAPGDIDAVVDAARGRRE